MSSPTMAMKSAGGDAATSAFSTMGGGGVGGGGTKLTADAATW